MFALSVGNCEKMCCSVTSSLPVPRGNKIEAEVGLALRSRRSGDNILAAYCIDGPYRHFSVSGLSPNLAASALT